MSARAPNRIPGEETAIERRQPFDGEFALQAIMCPKVNRPVWHAGNEQSEPVPKLDKRLTGFHHLQAVGGIRGDGRTGDGNNVRHEASSCWMSSNPRTI